jgi:protein arginine N-methyltransferase 5
MALRSALNPESEDYQSRPNFYLGQHDSDRSETLTDDQYYQILDTGVSVLVFHG